MVNRIQGDHSSGFSRTNWNDPGCHIKHRYKRVAETKCAHSFENGGGFTGICRLDHYG